MLLDKSTLICTLGTEPQVVTAVYDLLSNGAVNFKKLIVIHTTGGNPAISHAVARLQTELGRHQYQQVDVTFQPIIGERIQHLQDIESKDAVQQYFRLLYQLIWREKQAGHTIHLSIAGGRKTMAVYGMTVAQMLFDEHDRLWHLYSGGDFLTSKRLHPQPGDEVHLIPIPVIQWSTITPVMSNLYNIDDPYLALQQIETLRLREKFETGKEFIQQRLTDAEQRVVELLVKDGASDQQIASKLFISPRTVEQHLRSAYMKAETHWNLSKVNRTQLISLLQYYYSTRLGEITDDESAFG